MPRTPNLAIRDQVVAAARDLFFRNGYEGVSMADVAKAAGIKKPSLFHYYPSKETLALAVLDDAAKLLRQRGCELLARADSPIESICSIFREGEERARTLRQEGKHFFGLVATDMARSSEVLRKKVCSNLDIWVGAIAEVLQRGVESGELRKDVPCVRLAKLILSLYRGCMIHMEVFREENHLLDAEKMVRQCLSEFLIIDC